LTDTCALRRQEALAKPLKEATMTDSPTRLEHKGRRILLRLIGGGLLLAGLFSVFLGPIEMICFTFFSEGGRFAYEGFGFGSFMFGNLAAQIMGYYLIGALLIPIGYGTLTLQRWARHLTLAMLRFWVVAGLPLILAAFFVLLSSKDVTLPTVIVVAVLLAASYLLLPRLGTRFYDSAGTRQSFREQETNATWIEGIPVPALALGYVFASFLLILHTHIYFNGMFPLFGTWLSGLPGIVAIDIALCSLAVVLWGTLRRSSWGWWGGLAYFSLMALSYVLTLLSSTWQGILSTADFPAYEVEILQGIPAQGYHLAILVGVPFALTIWLIVRARPCFERQDRR
jgi:hypothetical protein